MTDEPPQCVNPCVWPDCLTAEQQQTLAENVRLSMLGEETGPDPLPACDCPERLAAEFEAHAEESLALANEAFDAVVQSWPEE